MLSELDQFKVVCLNENKYFTVAYYLESRNKIGLTVLWNYISIFFVKIYIKFTSGVLQNFSKHAVNFENAVIYVINCNSI